MFLKRLLRRLIFLVQVVLVVLFIVFEEIIWETIARPIYDYIHELHLLQTIQRRLSGLNRYALLTLFLVLLVSVEGVGLLAGVMAVRGMVITAAVLYAFKIPIATFTFWLFHVTESRLMSFAWFKWSYEQIVALFVWIRSREIYQETMEQIHWAKEMLRKLKARYFSGDKTLARRFRRLYRIFKRMVRRGEDQR